ncbi:Polypyrimidine tract-binding protein 3 [Eufriesea mexicana]|nr:Polypyrimidine tract-binding protein 3 [Eufriesea mexicana]
MLIKGIKRDLWHTKNIQQLVMEKKSNTAEPLAAVGEREKIFYWRNTRRQRAEISLIRRWPEVREEFLCARINFDRASGKEESLAVAEKKNSDTRDGAFLEMADENAAATMVNYYATCMAQLRGRAVYVQFSNHRELKTDQTHTNNALVLGWRDWNLFGVGFLMFEERLGVDSATEFLFSDGFVNSNNQVALPGQNQVAQTQAETQGGPNTVLRVIVEQMIYQISLDVLYQTGISRIKEKSQKDENEENQRKIFVDQNQVNQRKLENPQNQRKIRKIIEVQCRDLMHSVLGGSTRLWKGGKPIMDRLENTAGLQGLALAVVWPRTRQTNFSHSPHSPRAILIFKDPNMPIESSTLHNPSKDPILTKLTTLAKKKSVGVTLSNLQCKFKVDSSKVFSSWCRVPIPRQTRAKNS